MNEEVHPVLLTIVDILAEYGEWVIAEREQLGAASDEEKQPMILQRDGGKEGEE